jgi:hypothetical protein
MKYLFGAAVLLLVFSMPVSAQGYYGSYGSVGGGPSLNSGSSLNSRSGWGGPSFHNNSDTTVTRFHMSVEFGSPDFIPSTFVPFAQAVEQGRALNTSKPKTLAQAAADYRATKKPKAEVAFVQDDSGKAIMVQR